MADDHHGAAARGEIALEPLDRGQIEMIGRLIEKENVRLWRQHPRQSGAARLAAGELRGILVSGEAELLEERTRGIAVVIRAQPRLHIGQRRGETCKVGLLRQIAQERAGLQENVAAVRVDETRRDLEQRRFARAVTPDQRHAFAGRHRKLRAR